MKENELRPPFWGKFEDLKSVRVKETASTVLVVRGEQGGLEGDRVSKVCSWWKEEERERDRWR